MNRGKLDIVANMLTATQKDALKGYIMDACRLSSKQFNEYIQLLLQSGLVDAFPVGNLWPTRGYNSKRQMIYHMSGSGKRFLELYSGLRALVDRRVANSFGGISYLPSAKKDFVACPTNKR